MQPRDLLRIYGQIRGFHRILLCIAGGYTKPFDQLVAPAAKFWAVMRVMA